MNKKNLSTIIIPVLICIIVFLFPSWIQESLILKMNNLNLWSWFTHIFVHENLQHLSVNLIMFVISMFMVYVILPKNNKENFYSLTLLMIILVPIFTFIITLYLRYIGLFPVQLVNHRGFSGISSAASGFLCFAIAKKILFLWNQEKDRSLLLHLCYFIFTPSLAIIVWKLSLKFAIFIFLFWILTILSLIWLLKRKKAIITKKRLNKKEIGLMALGLLVLFFGVSLLVPEKVVSNGSVTNIFAHLIGFVTGFALIFGFLFHKLKNTKIKNKKRWHPFSQLLF